MKVEFSRTYKINADECMDVCVEMDIVQYVTSSYLNEAYSFYATELGNSSNFSFENMIKYHFRDIGYFPKQDIAVEYKIGHDQSLTYNDHTCLNMSIKMSLRVPKMSVDDCKQRFSKFADDGLCPWEIKSININVEIKS